METLTRVHHAQQRIVKVQRRVWLAQVLMWLIVSAAGLLSIIRIVRTLRRPAAGRHEMPDMAGAHETGTIHVEADGRLSEN